MDILYVELARSILSLLFGLAIFRVIEEIIRLQTSYYGAAINDIQTAIQKYSIVSDISRILMGIVLVKFNRWLPPLNKTMGSFPPLALSPCHWWLSRSGEIPPYDPLAAARSHMGIRQTTWP